MHSPPCTLPDVPPDVPPAGMDHAGIDETRVISQWRTRLGLYSTPGPRQLDFYSGSLARQDLDFMQGRWVGACPQCRCHCGSAGCRCIGVGYIYDVRGTHCFRSEPKAEFRLHVRFESVMWGQEGNFFARVVDDAEIHWIRAGTMRVVWKWQRI
jgi:hypothetical protein